MKKIILAIAAAAISATAVNTVNAQSANISSLSDAQLTASLSAEKPRTGKSAEVSNAISVKALKNFKRSFKSAANETWEKITDGFEATFSKDDVQNNVRYDVKGNWVATIKIYDAQKLPASVYGLVKSNYSGYSLTIVQEVSMMDGTVYLIHIQNCTTHKIIRVIDDNMDEFESFERAL